MYLKSMEAIRTLIVEERLMFTCSYALCIGEKLIAKYTCNFSLRITLASMCLYLDCELIDWCLYEMGGR